MNTSAGARTRRTVSRVGSRRETDGGILSLSAIPEIEPVATLLAVAAGVERLGIGDGDGVDELHPEPFTGAAGGGVVGVAGDPQRLQPVQAAQRQQQTAGALSEVAAARGRVDVVADVAVIHLDRTGRSDPQADPPGDP